MSTADDTSATNAFDADPIALQADVRRILTLAEPGNTSQMLNQRRLRLKLDGILMHPVWGLIILAALLFVIFQAVFSWATLPMGWHVQPGYRSMPCSSAPLYRPPMSVRSTCAA